MEQRCPKCKSRKKYVPLNPLNDNCKCIECKTEYKLNKQMQRKRDDTNIVPSLFTNCKSLIKEETNNLLQRLIKL